MVARSTRVLPGNWGAVHLLAPDSWTRSHFCVVCLFEGETFSKALGINSLNRLKPLAPQ